MKSNRARLMAVGIFAALGLGACGKSSSPPPQAGPSAPAKTIVTLKVSHQFPGTSGDTGDFRDRLARKFGADVEQRTSGQVRVEVYPSSALYKPDAQFTALQQGALDLTVLPLAYAGGKVPEVNITLMPALIGSYEQAARWKDAPIGKAVTDILEKNGVKVLTWIWQAGGIASSSKPIVSPQDLPGTKIRGAGKYVDLMLQDGGGAITNMPSSEIYNAMQTKVLDAAITSSTSLISYRLYEHTKAVTTAKNAFWYMFEPLLMSKAVFDKLTSEQQQAVLEAGASLESFAFEQAKFDDQELVRVFSKAGATAHDMTDAQFAQWKALAEKASWAEFTKTVPSGAELLRQAQAVK